MCAFPQRRFSTSFSDSFNQPRSFCVSSGALIDHWIGPGINRDTRWKGFMQLRYQTDRIRVGAMTFPRQQLQFYQRISPSRRLTQIGIDGYVGQDVDFVNVRVGRGGTVNLNATINATDHLVFTMIANTTWLHVNDNAGVSRPLFTARVERLRTNYTFTAQPFGCRDGPYDRALHRLPARTDTSANRDCRCRGGHCAIAS
jgi:hypothetical protein